MEVFTCITRLRLNGYFKISLLILGVLLISPHFMMGQITVPSSTFPATGDKLRYVQAANPNAAISLFTPPGGNQNWDLSALTPATTFETNYRPAIEGANAASFPGATIVVINGTDEYYYKSSATKFELLGQASSTVGGLPLKALYINQPTIAVRHSPLNFFDIYLESSGNLLPWAYSEIPNGAINLPVTPDSIRFRISSRIVEAVDGWGTLTLPGAPQPQFPVLRVKKTTYHEQRIDAKVPPLGWFDVTDIVRGGGPWANLFGVDTTVTHHYFNDVSKEEIAILTFNTEQNSVISVVYKNAATVSNPCPSVDNVTVNVPNPVCSGSSLTFTAKATGTGTLTVKWQRKGADDTNYTDVTTATAYTSGTNTEFTIASIGTVDHNAMYRALFTSSGCTDPVNTTAVTLLVNPLLTPSVSLGVSPGTTICAGTSVTFTATPTNGGTTPIYKWTINTTVQAETGATLTRDNLANNDMVKVEITSNATCASPATATDMKIMTLGTALTPSVSLGVSPGTAICTGTSVTFTATPTNGGTTPTYKWIINTTVQAETGVTLTLDNLANNDVVKVEMTSNSTCVSQITATNMKTMKVNPVIFVDAGPACVQVYSGYDSASGCTNLTATASGNGTAGYTYAWRKVGSATVICTEATINVCPTADVTYSVTATKAGCKATDMVDVKVLNVSCNINQTQVCHDGSTLCIDKKDVPFHLAHGDKLGTCRLNSLCTNNTNALIANETIDVIQLYPNPANDAFTLKLGNITQGIARFEIIDLSGKVIKTFNRSLTKGYNEVTLDVQNLSNGLHIIKIIDMGNHEAVVKMIKK